MANNISPNLVSQVIFGIFIVLILTITGTPLPLSIVLGIIGAVTLGWVTTASKNNPQPQSVASTDGIDAGLKYWLFFLLGFTLLRYPPHISILLGGIAGLGGGWIIAWWGSKEETRTQLQVQESETDDAEQPRGRVTKQQSRKPTRRFRRPTGSFNFKFWER